MSKIVNTTLTKKQKQAFTLINDFTTQEILFGGAAGGGKSYKGCFALIYHCLTYPESAALMGRAVRAILRKTTLRTFWQTAKALEVSDLFRENIHENKIICKPTGSVIFLQDLFFPASDTTFDALGGLEFGFAFIDEVPEVREEVYHTLRLRCRFKIDEIAERKVFIKNKNRERLGMPLIDEVPNGIGKMFSTCNPSKNWLKRRFYDPAKSGTLPPDRAFIQSLPSENPFLPATYEETIRASPSKAVRERYLGNWEYDDNPNKLIQQDALDAIFSNTHVSEHAGGAYLSADIAGLGSDLFVIGVWKGFALVDFVAMEKSNGPEIVNTIRSLATKHSVPGFRIVYDADGIGSALAGFFPQAVSFNANSPAKSAVGLESWAKLKENYKNLKAQCSYRLAKLVNAGLIQVACETGQYRERMRNDIDSLQADNSGADLKLSVLGKDKVKATLGRSPDFLDMFVMRMYFTLKPQLQDPRDTAYLQGKFRAL